MSRRMLSILGILVLAIAVLATSCAAPSATAAPTATKPAQTDAGNGLMVPIAWSGETIKVLLPQNEGGKDWNTDTFPVLQALEKATGVKLELESYPSDSYGTVVDARLAAKSALPDMFVADQRKYDLRTLAAVKVIVPLTDLITANAPNFTKVLAARTDVKSYVTSAGVIYGWPGLVRDKMFDLLLNMYRQDWVDAGIANFGLKFSDGSNEPKTIDDWTKMLQLFKDQGDPTVTTEDKSKVVGLEMWHHNKVSGFAAGYGLSPQSSWLSIVDGKVVFDFVGQEAAAKAFTQQFADWYAAGLIDQDYGEDSDAHSARSDADIASNLGGADVEWSGYAAYWNKTYKAANGTDMQKWMIAKCPTTSFVANPGYEQYPLCNYERWLVTTEAKDPAMIVKWLDYVFATEAGQTLMNFGIKDTDYSVNADGAKVFTDNVIKNTLGGETYLATIGISRFPRMGLYAAMSQLIGASPLQAGGPDPKIAANMEAYLATARVFFPDTVPTKDESDQLGNKLSVINDYAYNQLILFIIGKKSIATDWDAFVTSLKTDYNLDTILSIKQAQYDRFVGK
jgi:putative aldouronate transport system substrate-binding protein